MRLRKLVAGSSLCAILLLTTAGPSAGQEHEPATDNTAAAHEGKEHEFHRNHFGGVIGVTTHHDVNDSGLTLGLACARQFSPKWAIAAYLEMVSSSAERDVILAVGGAFYPIPPLNLILAVGPEWAEKETAVHDTMEKEIETEFMVRIGVGYVFKLTSQASIGPAVFADRAGDRWASLVSIGMVVGF
jgi:hypothetical protein